MSVSVSVCVCLCLSAYLAGWLFAILVEAAIPGAASVKTLGKTAPGGKIRYRGESCQEVPLIFSLLFSNPRYPVYHEDLYFIIIFLDFMK